MQAGLTSILGLMEQPVGTALVAPFYRVRAPILAFLSHVRSQVSSPHGCPPVWWPWTSVTVSPTLGPETSFRPTLMDPSPSAQCPCPSPI